MKISAATLAVALILGGTSVVLPADSAQAQALESLRNRQARRPPAGQCRLDAPEGQPAFQITQEECQAIAAVLTPLQTQDWATAQAALPAAQAAAQGRDAKYQVGQLMLRIGIGTTNTQLQAQAIDALIASGGARPEEMTRLYQAQLDFATRAGDTAKAERARAQLLALNPNDPSNFIQMAQGQRESNPAGALQLYQRAIQAQEAAGQPVPEQWRQQMVAVAYAGRLPQAVGLARELAASTRNPAYFRDALIIYRQLGRPEASAELDIYRLQRASGALSSEADYVQYAEVANRGAMFGEVKAVLEEGLSRNVITAANTGYAREMLSTADRRTSEDRASLGNERRAAMAGSDARAVLRLADAYYGYGQYADAIELYRAALQKGADANLVNTRLGAALAMAGQRADAETAFRAVTGARAELASFWLLWLSSRT